MPRPALTEEQRRETRRAIRQAAADLYARGGDKDISVRSVAEQAGVSVGTIYTHFSNLTELMQSLWKQPAKRLLEEMEAVSHSIEDPQARLKALLDTYANFAQQQHQVYRGAFLYVRTTQSTAPEPVKLEDDRLFQLFQRTIVSGQEQEQFIQGDPMQLAQAVWSAIHGAIALPINIDRLALDRSPQRVHDMIEIMLGWLTKDSL